jgi:hypothetical protein
MFLFSCAGSKAATADNNAQLEETKALAEQAVKQLHDLQVEKAKLEAEKAK